MPDLTQYLPILIPLALIQMGLLAAALVHIFRHNSYRRGNRVLWVILSICLSTIGPILYFCLGRGDEGNDE